MKRNPVIDVLVIAADDLSTGEVRAIVPDLDTFRGILGGGWLEGVGVGNGWSAYCDEEGKIKGLPVNVRATRLARMLGWPSGDVLCGTVVFMGQPDHEGEDTSVADDVLATARGMGYIE